MLTVLVAFATSVVACELIVRSARWHLHVTADPPGNLPQKFHTRPVPRIGGLGLLAGLVAGGMMLPLPSTEQRLFWLLIASLVPAFLGGFLEDVTRKVGPGTRLLLTVVTAALAFSVAGVEFTRADVAWLNAAIATVPLGYCMLLFAVAGVAHSINIIDGYHGLAGGVSTIILAALGYVAFRSGDALVASVCLTTAGATVGFLLLNYPSGRLFLGDGGAYLLGCVIALAGALLIQRNPGVSPWFPMALVIYPVWETLFSVLRRRFLYRTRIGQPDARHLHSLVFRRVVQRRLADHDAREARAHRNHLTAPPFWGASCLVGAVAVAVAGDTAALQLLIAMFMLGYTAIYWRVARLGTLLRSNTAGRPRGRPESRGAATESGTRA